MTLFSNRPPIFIATILLPFEFPLSSKYPFAITIYFPGSKSHSTTSVSISNPIYFELFIPSGTTPILDALLFS